MNKLFEYVGIVFMSLFVLVFFVFSGIMVLDTAFGYSFVGVTSNGVEFPIKPESFEGGENATMTADETTAQSILNGFGYTANIITIEQLGIVIVGEDIIGKYSEIRPYTITESNYNIGAVITDDDLENIYLIDEFWFNYSYNNNTDIITNITEPPPNILGYSESRDVIGSNVVVTTDNGITVSGTGSTIIKLIDYANDRIILTGNYTSGGNVKLIYSDNVDLINDSYGPNGFTVPYSIPVVVGLDSTHYGTASWSSGYTYRSQSCAGPTEQGYYYVVTSYSYYSSTSTVTATITETGEGDHMLITGLSGYSPTAPASTGGAVLAWCQHYVNSGVQDGWVSGVTLAIYDTLPAYTLLDYDYSFVVDYTFPAEQTYLYVEPNGGTITILGQEITGTPELTINNLPENIPWQLSKNGWIISSGVTSSDGNITVTENDVSFDGFVTESGLLHLYPDSMSYRGAYTSIMFDTINDEIIHTSQGVDNLYVPAAYVKLPIPVSIEFDNISVGSVSYDYLAGNYTAGDEIFVPIIPEMTTLDLTLNGVNAVIKIGDLDNTSQLKLLSENSISDSLYSNDDVISSIEVGISNTVVAIATHTGDMNVVIDVTVSGDAEFTINSDYSESYDLPLNSCEAATIIYGPSYCGVRFTGNDGLVYQAVVDSQAAYESTLIGHEQALKDAITASGPLTVLVDIYNNGDYVDSFEIYRDFNPIFTASSELGLVSIQNANINYLQSSGSRSISIDVQSGDYVEFVVNVSIIASGIPTPVNLDDSSIVGFARATVNLHYGSITASMG